MKARRTTMAKPTVSVADNARSTHSRAAAWFREELSLA
jgi:hypothetical protein